MTGTGKDWQRLAFLCLNQTFKIAKSDLVSLELHEAADDEPAPVAMRLSALQVYSQVGVVCTLG